MNYKSILLSTAVMLTAGGAAAQVDPGMHEWAANVFGDRWASAYAEAVTDNVVTEHWVLRDPTDVGMRFTGGQLSASGRRHASADEFLRHMWYQSIELDERWFYARQTVVYMPLLKVDVGRFSREAVPLACTVLTNERRQTVGVHVRTHAWSLYTDHWVLYPHYRAPTERSSVTFTDVTEEGCPDPRAMVAAAWARAQETRDGDAYRYATATFALVPLEPSHFPPQSADPKR